MNDNQQNDSMFWDFFINLALVGSAAFLYFKTAEVMTALAPETLLGYKGLGTLYGAGTALFIEGVMLALHFLRRFEGNARAEGYKWFLFGVSTFCQFLDGTVIKQILGQQQLDATGEFFKWVALGIMPAVAAGLLWVKGGSKHTAAKRVKKGLIPSLKETLYGTENTEFSNTSQPVQMSQDVGQVKTSRKNGRHVETEEVTDPK
jgi:hypothetical protein